MIIMTSNLGAKQQESLGFGEQPPSYEAEVLSFFRPEFFNRIDMVVTFNPLNKATILAITEKELREISVGSEHLTALVELLVPKYVFCAHMHVPAQYWKDNTDIVCLSDFHRDPQNAYVLLDSSTGAWKWPGTI